MLSVLAKYVFVFRSKHEDISNFPQAISVYYNQFMFTLQLVLFFTLYLFKNHYNLVSEKFTLFLFKRK